MDREHVFLVLGKGCMGGQRKMYGVWVGKEPGPPILAAVSPPSCRQDFSSFALLSTGLSV